MLVHQPRHALAQVLEGEPREGHLLHSQLRAAAERNACNIVRHVGSKGISLFAVPKKRPAGPGLVDNDVQVSGVIHKIGWRGLPSLALSFGDEGDCQGWLVGAPNQGLRSSFCLS